MAKVVMTADNNYHSLVCNRVCLPT